MFIHTGFLKDNEIQLILEKTADGNNKKEWVPAYYLPIGHNDKLYYGGNIGYSIYEKYRGNHYAGKACQLLFKLAKKHELQYLIITCNPDNYASRKTCEYAGGKLLEITRLPEDNDMRDKGETEKCIYKFTL